MAHDIKVETRPAKNKDGSDSKRNKVYAIIDRHRKNRTLVAMVHTKAEVEPIITAHREWALQMHLIKHPNDTAFRRKHGLL